MKHLMKDLAFILSMLILTACNETPSGTTSDKYDYLGTETSAEFDERMQWWRDAGFGMFIHWGLYAVPAGQYGEETNHAEWIQETADIPVEEYEKYTEHFNPYKYDALEWVKMAKDAGMKYIVITSKHHDGFCLWDSKVSDYDIADRTPYKKDLLKELAEACEKEGITLCFYHSIMDWNHPQAQGVNHPDYNYGKGPNPEFSEYVEDYMKPQLKELLSNYGHIGVLWFDGEWIAEWTEEQGAELYNYLRNIQPDLIINNRVGKGRQGMKGMNAYDEAAGDFGTPEQEILEGSSNMDWESCMTMNDHWGYNQFDNNFKSTRVLIHNLVDIAAKGGNYLLNVGPRADGLIPEESILRMKEIGDWIDVNGEVIHNSRGTRYYKEGSTYYIRSNDNKYLNAVLTEWPGKSIILKYADPIEEATINLLGYDNPLNWERKNLEGIEIELPEAWQNAEDRPVQHAWVLKMEGKQALVSDPPMFAMEGKEIDNKMIVSDEIKLEIETSSPEERIYYTTDGSIPGKSSKEYNKTLNIASSTEIQAISVRPGYVDSPVSRVEVLFSGKIKNIDYEFPYSSKYSAYGDLSLADEILGDKDNFTENWLGFQGTDFIATVELAEPVPINFVGINFLHNIRSWIFSPEYVEVSISKDGENFHSALRKESTIALDDDELSTQLFNFSYSEKEASFVRIVAKNITVCPDWHQGAGGEAWLFTDEIIIN